MMTGGPLRVAAVLAVAVACGEDDDEPCFEVDCVDTVSIDFASPGPGEYAATLTLTLDREPAPCTITLPRDPELGESDCADNGVSVIGILGAEPLVIGYPGEVRDVAIRITRDGQVVAEDRFAPMYVAPPPGPSCPAQCRAATHRIGPT